MGLRLSQISYGTLGRLSVSELFRSSDGQLLERSVLTNKY